MTSQELEEERQLLPKKEKKPTKLDINIVAEYLTKLAEPLKKFIRGIHGESPEDDVFSGLIKVQDDRERARLTSYQGQANAYRELLSQYGGEEWQIMKDIAIMKNIYSIGSSDGEQWKDAILMVHARQPTTQPLALVTPQIQQAQSQPKKHFWQRTPKTEESKSITQV